MANREILNLDAGHPSGLFRKDVIRVGRYVHPRTGQVVNVDEARLHRWADNFRAMKALGQPVKAAKGHNIMEPLGDVVEMSVDTADPAGAALVANIRFADAEAVQYAKRAGQVSATIIGEWLSNAGKALTDVIHYIAVTPDPVVPGGEFVALSRVEEKPGKENAAMLEKLSKMLGCEATEEAIVKAIEALHEKHGAAVAAHESAARAHESAATAHAANMDRLGAALGCEAKPDAIEAAVKALKPGTVELSREGKLLVDAYADKLSALVSTGALNAATAAALKPLLVDDTVRLARDGELEAVGKLLAALAGNAKRVATGSATGAQLPKGSSVAQLSREGDDPEAKDAKKNATASLRAEIEKNAKRK
jgi:hypothetical protein